MTPKVSEIIDFRVIFPVSARLEPNEASPAAQTFLRILEHAGQLLHKFQAVPLTRSRDIGVLKWKNFPKVGLRRPDGTSTALIFVDFQEFFHFSHTNARDLVKGTA